MAGANRAARALAPRVYPAGRAALLLGVCGPELAGRKIVVEGRRVCAIAYGRIALLVAFVDPEAYDSQRIAAVRADALQFATEARLLERSVERAAASGVVIPARVLSVYADPEALETHAREHVARWARALARLGTKRECVVHVYAGPHVPPGGSPFVARVSARASRSGRVPVVRAHERVTEHALALWRACAGAALAVRRVRSTPERGALWTASFLVSENDVAALEQIVERATEGGMHCGVTAHFEGPRLPYSFV